MRFKEFLQLDEASYVGNIGMMEMFKFYQVATPDEKAHMKELLYAGKQEAAWDYLQRVTGVKLHTTPPSVD